ncbi:MAG: GGDEF domain-containing protein [Candidatus Omnitrophica bacterium]|nr:GGDEF domain-containing protein [Candidatus Omnitrophota bacterium]
MTISSRARSLFAVLSVIFFLLSSYASWTLSSRAISQSPFYLTLVISAITSFNLPILFGWIGFGVLGGAAITAGTIFFVLLLDFRMGYSAHQIVTITFLVTAAIGYLFARSKNRSDQLYILESERTEEEINILANEVKEKNKGIKALEGKLMKYSAFKDIAESLSTTLSTDAISSLFMERTPKILGKSGRVLLFLVDALRQELMLLASSVKNEAVIKAKKGDVFDHWILRHRKPLIIEDVKRDFRFPAEGAEAASGVFNSLIAAPLMSENKVIGILRVDSAQELAFSQDDLRLLDIISNLAAVAIQNSMFYARTQELAIRDGLTGLRVRRFFTESLRREVKRAARRREQLSLLMLDIDHFKEYNDKYGHAAGDNILQHLSQLITGILGEDDVAGRYGGEEIAILLWRKKKKDAIAQAEKIRKLVKDSPVILKDNVASVTVSIGIATFPEDALSEEEMIRIADQRLYKAKAEGRDRVCSA